jgi:hypothetical protein
MPKTIRVLAMQILFSAGALVAQPQSDWTSTLNEPDIQYRSQVFDASKACYVEFRDQQQGNGPTTFDAAVDYTSSDSSPDKQPAVKTDSEHIVTTASHFGSSRISNCSGIVAARITFVRRQ